MTASAEGDETLVYECELDASLETVWRAVTIPEFLEQWIGSPPDTKEAEAPSYRIVEKTPCSEIRYAWTDEAADRRESVVTISLDAAPEGRTFFRLTHSAGKIPLAAANQNLMALHAAA